MSDLNGSRTTSNIIAAIVATISLAALVMSLYSNKIADRSLEVANKSHELAVTESKSQRALILGSTVSDDGQTIKLKTTDPNVALQEAHVFLPSALGRQSWQLLPPDYKLHAIQFSVPLQEILEKLGNPKSRFGKTAVDKSMPIVISSTYTAKGEVHYEQSLYRIMYSFVISDKYKKPPTVNLKWLVYIRRLDAKESPHEAIEQLSLQDASVD